MTTAAESKVMEDGFFTKSVKDSDPEVNATLESELKRQQDQI